MIYEEAVNNTRYSQGMQTIPDIYRGCRPRRKLCCTCLGFHEVRPLHTHRDTVASGYTVLPPQSRSGRHVPPHDCSSLLTSQQRIPLQGFNQTDNNDGKV